MKGCKKLNLDREIWQLLWPILLLTLAQKIGNVFEGILVSVNSSDELTIMGLCSPYISLITTASYGLGIGVNAMIGQASGDGTWSHCRRQMERVILVIVLICGSVLSAVTALALWTAFSEITELAFVGWNYMLPYLIGSPLLLLFTVLISAMRGLGDTKAGMWMTFFAVPLQLVISWICYTAWGLGALGYGTLLSRLAGCIYGYWRYRKLCGDASEYEHLREGFVTDFLKLAIPVSLSKIVSPAANAAINSLLLSVGTAYVGASSLGGRLEAFFYLPAMAMGNVAVTMVARRGKKTDIRDICIHLCGWSLLPTLIMCIAAGLFKETIWNLMTPDPVIWDAGQLYWRICLLAYPMIALEMTVTGILQAVGCGMPALVVTIVRLWVIQLPAAWMSVHMGWGAVGIWVGYFMGNLISLLISTTWAVVKLRERWNMKKTC